MDLTPENFIMKIKEMDKADRNKLKLKDLIDLIVKAPLAQNDENSALNLFQAQMQRMQRIDSFVDKCNRNQVDIAFLTAKNEELEKKNADLQEELNSVKENTQNVPKNDELNELRSEVNEIQQYLRINNLELVGLPEANKNESEETLLIHALNSLDGIVDPIRPEDIDISHPMKSKRKDNKRVHESCSSIH